MCLCVYIYIPWDQPPKHPPCSNTRYISAGKLNILREGGYIKTTSFFRLGSDFTTKWIMKKRFRFPEPFAFHSHRREVLDFEVHLLLREQMRALMAGSWTHLLGVGSTLGVTSFAPGLLTMALCHKGCFTKYPFHRWGIKAKGSWESGSHSSRWSAWLQSPCRM